ncbi:MAG: hypothetical protein RR091_07135, partial [Cloacibacillus sp.]
MVLTLKFLTFCAFDPTAFRFSCIVAFGFDFGFDFGFEKFLKLAELSDNSDKYRQTGDISGLPLVRDRCNYAASYMGRL